MFSALLWGAQNQPGTCSLTQWKPEKRGPEERAVTATLQKTFLTCHHRGHKAEYQQLRLWWRSLHAWPLWPSLGENVMHIFTGEGELVPEAPNTTKALCSRFQPGAQ